MKSKAGKKVSSPYVTFTKWSLMAIMVMWAIIYRLGQPNLDLPGFVYVNF